MSIEELRIGNLVYIPGLFQISTIYEPILGVHIGGEVETKSTISHVSMFEPIPLTEEWLLKFGFQNTTPDGWLALNVCNDWTFLFWHKGVLELSVNRHAVVLSKITTVHQLQNVFFELCGEELTFNNENNEK